jgi:hypothetical protein
MLISAGLLPDIVGLACALWLSDFDFTLLYHRFVGLFAMSTTSPSTDTPSFEPRPTFQYAATVGMQAGLVGAFVSSVQNALGSHSKGASGFLSRTGGTIGFFGAFHLSALKSPSPRISDDFCVAGSCHGCNIRRNRIHRRKPTGKAGCAEWCSWWLRSRLSSRYQRCAPPRLQVPFRANLFCSSFPTDSRCFLCSYWGCSGNVRHCWSIITGRSRGAVL